MIFIDFFDKRVSGTCKAADVREFGLIRASMRCGE